MDENMTDKLKDELDAIYTPLEEAKVEILRRWNDKDLRKKVEEYLKGDIPEILKEGPRPVMARSLISPNFELKRFLELSKLIGLKPLFLEYINDKFRTQNIDKYYLCKLYFHHGCGKKGGEILSALKVVDFDKAEGQKICDLRTLWGQDLADLHSDLMHLSELKESVDKLDFSNYLSKNGPSANKYYSYFFSLLICYGILFENYLLDDRQVDFTKNVILPSFKKVLNQFGLKPLIVKLGPLGEEESLYWRYYPGFLEASLSKTNYIK